MSDSPREIGVVVFGDAWTVHLGGEHAAGRVAIVDAADHEAVARYNWSATWDTKRPDDPYAAARVNGRVVTMHKFLTGYPQTDHRNHDCLDNRRSNLRAATRSQNNANQQPRSGTSSRHKGVYWHRQRGRWCAEITRDGKKNHLGLFESESAAARAYDAEARKVFGEFACLNFPDGVSPGPTACLRVGVDRDLVTLRMGGAGVRLGPAESDTFAHLFVSACWQAGENRRRMNEDVARSADIPVFGQTP